MGDAHHPGEAGVTEPQRLPGLDIVAGGDQYELGGEAACMAHLLCEECGAVLDGGKHAAWCTAFPSRPAPGNFDG